MGDTEYGALGDGTTAGATGPTVVSLPAGFDPVAIASAGGNATPYALVADGSVYALGIDNVGSLGLGSRPDPETCESSGCALTPVQVALPEPA